VINVKELENTFGQMELTLLVSLIRINSMDLVRCVMRMVTNIKVSGRMAKCMDLGNLYGRIRRNFWVTILKIKNRVLGCIHGQMEFSILEISWTIIRVEQHS
jgi:hypothetical protein